MDDHDRWIQITYPAFLIGVPENEKEVIGTEANGGDWILLYSTKELAELYIEQTGDEYVPRIALDDISLRRTLDAYPSVAGFLWDTTIQPQWFRFIERERFS